MARLRRNGSVQIQWRFAREALGSPELGVSRFTYEPGARMPWGHRHSEQEEFYVVVGGSGRVKVDDEVVELRQWDAIRFDKDAMRNMEAGPEGIEYIAFGAGNDPTDAEMAPGWWSD